MLERRSPVALEIPAVLAKLRLYREESLYNAYVRTGDVTQELAPVEPAKETWTRMEVDDGQRDDQVECEDQPEEPRRVLEAHQPTELEMQKHSQTNHAVFAPWCGIGKARTIRTQNLLRFLLHVRGRSFDANACVDIQQIREDSPQRWNRKH